MKQYNKPRKSCTLFGLGFMEMIPSPQLGFLRGVFVANHLASNDNLNQKTEHIIIIQTFVSRTLSASELNLRRRHTTKINNT